MKRLNKKHFSIIAVLAVAIALITLAGMKVYDRAAQRYDLPERPDNRHYATLSDRADAALEFAKRHNMNERYFIFIDYSIPSGKPRMFVWDNKKGEVIAKSYVMHGSGGGSTKAKPVFSNRPGSECSSLGRFKVTKERGKTYKRSFRLKGMDTDNVTARRRGLLIHASGLVDRSKGQKYLPIDPVSCKGCVTVSRQAMDFLYPFIKDQHKQMLLWSFNG